MATTRIFSAVLSASLCFGVAAFAAQADRIRGSIEITSFSSLRGSIHPKTPFARDNGALNPGTPINGITLVLSQTAAQQNELENFLEDQRDPSSPNYQHWLTPEEYGERFGLSENDLARIASWLQSRGFTVENVARAHNWISFSGTAGQIARTFRTELHHIEVDGEAHFANATDIWIPSSLAGVVGGIRGLDDFRPQPQRAKPVFYPDFNASNGSHYLAPDDLAVIYNIKALYDAGFDGTGQKLVIAGQTDVNVADLRAFRTQFNLPAKDPQLVLVGKNPGITQADQIEASLDLEWSGAVARNATVIYVYSQNVFTSLQYAIDQNLAPIMSLSYGGCELGSPTYFRTLAQQANAQGITWFNASGDFGAAGCDSGGLVATQGPAAMFPANIPEVTAVGGTEFDEAGGTYWSAQNNANLKSVLSYIPEKVWNDTPLGTGMAAGGGGASVIYTKPWWQNGPGVPQDNARDVPDVSLTASAVHGGYVMYANGGLLSVGGTSASSPAFAGIASILNQYLTAKGVISKPGLGNINPALYNLAQNTTGLFHDITSGDNIVPCTTGSKGCTTGSFGYTAGPGYDLATGLGSVDAFNLVTKWTSLPPGAGTTLSVAASPASILTGATTQLTATVTAVSGANTPSGTVAFLAGTTVLGSSVLTGSGRSATASLTVNGGSIATGDNTIVANYAPTGNFTNSSGSAVVSVTQPPADTVTTLNAAPASIASTGTTQITATVKPSAGRGAPAGTVTFSAGNQTLGAVTLANSGGIAALSVPGTSLAAGSNTIIATYGGSSGFNPSTSVPIIVTVGPAGTATSTAVTASPAEFAQSSQTVLTASVKALSGSAPPTGNVSFAAGNKLLGSAVLTGAGSAALTLNGTSLTAGNNTITATYSGNKEFGSSSAPVTVNVVAPSVASSTTIVADASSLPVSGSTQLTVTVRAMSGTVPPAGSVAFLLGSKLLGASTLKPSAGAPTAVATFTLKGVTLAPGDNSIVASYGGSSTFIASTATVTVNVIPSRVKLRLE